MNVTLLEFFLKNADILLLWPSKINEYSWSKQRKRTAFVSSLFLKCKLLRRMEKRMEEKELLISHFLY